jgi:hypothetical protein
MTLRRALSLRDNFEFLIDPPACSAFNNTTQSVADATTTTLTANSENFDNDAMHSTVTNTARLTVQTPGRYEFTCRVNFQADITDGRRELILRKNGTTSVIVNATRAIVDGTSMTISGFLKDTMIAGDYYECRVSHTAGNALNVTLQEFTALFMTR